MSGATDDLLATLSAAEACLRALVAEALPPDVAMRIELTSSRRARRALAEASVDRTLELPTGWAEFVELDASIDALLTRLAPAAPPATRARGELPVAPAPRPRPSTHAAAEPNDPRARADQSTATPEASPAPRPAAVAAPPAPPSAVTSPDSEATAWVSGLPDAVVDEVEEIYEVLDDHEDDDFTADAASAVAPEDLEELEEFEELDDPDERTQEISAVTTDPAPSVDEAEDEAEAEPVDLNEREQRWQDAQWVSYEEQPLYETFDDDDDLYEESTAYADEGVSYITYTEPTPRPFEAGDASEDEPLPDWAVKDAPPEDEPEAVAPRVRPLGKKKEVPEAPPPAAAAEPPPAEEEWSFSASGDDAGERAPGTVDPYAVLRRERMRLDDFSTVSREAEPELPDPEELSDPDPVDDTVPTARRSRPAGPAAIQLAADGSGRVLDDDDDDDESKVIELGDTRDYGDEEMIEDDQTGILGIGVVEYDEIEELEEIEELTTGLDDLPGAPELTPAEVSALMARAEETGRRNMAEGALLYTDVLDADPDRLDALVARGRLYLDVGDFPGAVSDFLKAEALQPRDADVQVALGDLFFGRKDYGKAVSYFNRALSLDGDHATALARRGFAHYQRRQFNAAVEDLERANKLEPGLPQVDVYLARARKRK